MNIPNANQFRIFRKNNTANNTATFYGGDQAWYTSNTRAMGGCGSVAGANALRALCRKNPSVRKPLVASKKIPRAIKLALCSPNPSYDDYSLLMTGVYETMGAFEIFPLNRIYDKRSRNDKFFSVIKPNQGRSNIGFIIGIIRFAHKFGINLRVRSLPTAFCSKDEAVDFIGKGLGSSGAVVLLTSYNKHSLQMFPANSNLAGKLTVAEGIDNKAEMRLHFATITDIDEPSGRLLISTWGKPATADLDEIVKSWHSIKAYSSTLFYLEPSTRYESVKSMFAAAVPLMLGIVQSLCRHRFVKKIKQ